VDIAVGEEERGVGRVGCGGQISSRASDLGEGGFGGRGILKRSDTASKK